MDYSAERYFTQTFILKTRRKRLFYELSTPEKRYDGVSRFCHQTKNLIIPEKIIMMGEDLDRQPAFRDFVLKHNELCYICSPDFSMDQKFMYLQDAVDQAVMCLDAVLILGSTFAVIYGEPMKGGQEKYLLSE